MHRTPPSFLHTNRTTVLYIHSAQDLHFHENTGEYDIASGYHVRSTEIQDMEIITPH